MIKPSHGLLIAAGLLFATTVLAKPNDSVLSTVIENDVIAGSDRHYTSGFLVSYVSGINRGPQRAANLGRRLPMIDADDDLHVGLSVGHEIYTPRRIKNPNLIPDDRPYAGYLYGAMDFTVSNARALSTWRLSAGIVGPSSRAEEGQRELHRRIGSPDPAGWEHQLKDEFAYNVSYERQWRPLCDTPRRNRLDVLPHLGLAAGNVGTYANVGAILRVGRNLCADYGPPRVRPALPGSMFFSPQGDDWTGYFYLGLDGRYVAHNIFLDGNSDKDSHSVEKRKWVGDLQLGFVVSTQRFRLAYSHVIRTKEFEVQRVHNRFGSLTLAMRL